MALKINKPGQTINDASYGALYVELNPFIELHYNRVSVNTKCYDFDDVSVYGLEGTWDSSLVIDPSGNYDVSVWIPPAQPIIPKNWERFNPMKFDFELEASTNLENWATEKAKINLTSIHHIPYEYMAYEEDVYQLDPSTGDPVLDPCTNEPIKLHSAGDLIKKENGTYLFYTRTIDRFCELADVSIL